MRFNRVLDSTRAERGALLILYAIIILFDDDTMFTLEKNDDTAAHKARLVPPRLIPLGPVHLLIPSNEEARI